MLIGSSMLLSTRRVPGDMVKSRCWVRSALAFLSALEANRLRLSSSTSARAMLLQASEWRGRLEQRSSSQPRVARRRWSSLSMMLGTMRAPSVGLLQLDKDAVGKQREGDERGEKNHARQIDQTLGEGVEVGEKAHRRHCREHEVRGPGA